MIKYAFLKEVPKGKIGFVKIHTTIIGDYSERLILSIQDSKEDTSRAWRRFLHWISPTRFPFDIIPDGIARMISKAQVPRKHGWQDFELYPPQELKAGKKYWIVYDLVEGQSHDRD